MNHPYRGGFRNIDIYFSRFQALILASSTHIQLIEAFHAETLQELIANLEDRHAAKACLGEFLLARGGSDIYQAKADLLLLQILLGCLAVRTVCHGEE